MSKLLLIVLLISIISNSCFAQSFPYFLEGTWKVENNETYEKWEKIDDNHLKGLSFNMKDGTRIVTEYLEIKKQGSNVIYTATVLNQNQGLGIDFKLNSTDSLFSFENEIHDFPKFIRYQSISENKMKATVGTNENNFTLYFEKIK